MSHPLAHTHTPYTYILCVLFLGARWMLAKNFMYTKHTNKQGERESQKERKREREKVRR